MAKRHITQAIITQLTGRGAAGVAGMNPKQLTLLLGEARSTVNQHLARLVKSGVVVREGAGPATVYRISLSASSGAPMPSTPASLLAGGTSGLVWSAAAQALRAEILRPLGLRAPPTYQRTFVDRYVPNDSSLLPAELARGLYEQGRLSGQQPAGTYARRVLEQLLIDLSWSSSRLEGNRKSLLDTQDLFRRGRSDGDDADATMLLNHKDAIEFIVEAVPEYGVSGTVVRNIQSTLMNGLLADTRALGATRQTIVNISDSVYIPTQVPALIDEMLATIVLKARTTRNPIEGAFFLWINIAHLQPFQDGNKRTSRLSANLPLLLSNCAPLSFLDVDPSDYAAAMLAVYEKQNVALAIDLFAWTYRRSVEKYRIVVESPGTPHPFRAKYRAHLGAAIQQIVLTHRALLQAAASQNIPEPDQSAFEELLAEELAALAPHNCARYRLSIGKTEEWIANGRRA